MKRRDFLAGTAAHVAIAATAQAAVPRPRLCIETSMFAGMKLPEVLPLVKRAGYHAVELGGTHLELGAVTDTQVDEAVRLVKDHGLALLAVFNVPRLAGGDDAAREKAVDRWKRSIDSAARVGLPLLTTELTGDVKQPDAGERQWRLGMDQLAPRLADAKVRLAVEPHPGDFFEDAARTIALMKSYDSPWLGYLHCMPHGDFLGPMADIARAAESALFHVHVADSFRQPRIMAKGGVGLHLHLTAGAGEMDFRGTYAALRSIGYAGALSVQLLSHRDHPFEEAVRSRQFLQRGLGARLAV